MASLARESSLQGCVEGPPTNRTLVAARSWKAERTPVHGGVLHDEKGKKTAANRRAFAGRQMRGFWSLVR